MFAINGTGDIIIIFPKRFKVELPHKVFGGCVPIKAFHQKANRGSVVF
jgi:hypothetical protein